MADNREPPPLFDDDDSRKDDDNDDLFSSAVQSPVNGQETTDVSSSAATTVTTSTLNPKPEDSISNHSSTSSTLLPVHPLSDPLQLDSKTAATNNNSVTKTLSPDTGIVDTSTTNNPTLLDPIPPNSNFPDPSYESSPSGNQSSDTMLEPASDEDLINSNLDSLTPVMTSTTITNLPPVPSNMYNISSMGGANDNGLHDSATGGGGNMDLFESCVEDSIIRPFSTVTLGEHQEVSLDDDDDGLFSGGALDKAQLKTTLDNSSGMGVGGGAASSSPASLPPMGAPLTPPAAASPPPPATLPSTTFSSGGNTPTAYNSQSTPSKQPAGFYSQSTTERIVSNNTNSDGEYIEILISEPQKVGDGMGSYMAYKMTTRTNIAFFRKNCWSVTRRFSDYLGLHAKLVEKHLHAGRIIPPAPEKDALNTTKLRLSSSEGGDGAAEFLERRRASLQRYMQRTAALQHLRTDPDFREFCELDAELPRATQTSAMSGAGVMRLFNRVGETVNKITFKMEENDQWFEERVQQVEALEVELRRLHASLEGLAGGRRELAACSGSLSKAAAVLSSVEEHTALSRALHQLAEATDRTHTVYHAQADADFYILCETTRDYINLIGAVKEVFHERVKVYQAWQYSQTLLAKKREAKAKLELAARQEKVAQAQQEVVEWEGKVERNQEHFTRISAAIKKELEQFDVVRVQDFKNMLIRYLEAMVTSQQQVIKVWESFLPEAKAIS